ncbi:uncharacterized protein [Eschrichtius robustus]|uniref:uncharacterized protein n=1 Tax=Eschrichtius robustus TaxID=9764 RepID=UPI0035C043CE
MTESPITLAAGGSFLCWGRCLDTGVPRLEQPCSPEGRVKSTRRRKSAASGGRVGGARRLAAGPRDLAERSTKLDWPAGGAQPWKRGTLDWASPGRRTERPPAPVLRRQGSRAAGRGVSELAAFSFSSRFPGGGPSRAGSGRRHGRRGRDLAVLCACYLLRALAAESQVGMFQVGRSSLPKPAARNLEDLDSVQRVLFHRIGRSGFTRSGRSEAGPARDGVTHPTAENTTFSRRDTTIKQSCFLNISRLSPGKRAERCQRIPN